MTRPIDIAKSYLGETEVIGPKSNPAILRMLQMDNAWPKDDSTPWCAAFVNWCCWRALYVHSTSLMARSYLGDGMGHRIWTTGQSSDPIRAGIKPGDVLVFNRGRGRQPGPDVHDAPGHVGFYTGHHGIVRNWHAVWVLGGNQGDAVSVKPYSTTRLLAAVRPKTIKLDRWTVRDVAALSQAA